LFLNEDGNDLKVYDGGSAIVDVLRGHHGAKCRWIAIAMSKECHFVNDSHVRCKEGLEGRVLPLMEVLLEVLPQVDAHIVIE
jgi:hypothetical protein